MFVEKGKKGIEVASFRIGGGPGMRMKNLTINHFWTEEQHYLAMLMKGTNCDMACAKPLDTTSN